jgi:hypothetical protein
MRSNARMLLSVFLVAAIAGCGGSGDSTPADSGDEGSDQAASTKMATPDVAVAEFLEAVRVGNDQKAAEMFTPLARQKVAELKIQVAPPGSDTATFSIGEVEYMAEDGARVAATWTDLDEKGKPRTDQMTWMVRREPEGWRVAGMATVVFPGEPPLLLDFEKPQETLRKLDLVREEVMRRAQTANLPPTELPNSEHSIRR